MNLNEFLPSVPEFSGWGIPDQIKFVGWFIHSKRQQDRFTAADVNAAYDKLHLTKPPNTYTSLDRLHKQKQLLKDKRGYYLVRDAREMLDAKYGQRQISIQVAMMLMELPAKVPDVAEREFLDEALKCYKVAAFRAAIVMAWNLAYDHLLSYILKHKLTVFNAQWPVSFARRHAQARVSAVSHRDEFSELKESELLLVCKSAAIISPDVYKIMDEKLDKRNSAAHPSGVNIGQLQAENFLDDLVKNVVLKIIV